MCQTGSIGVLVYVQHFNQKLVLMIQQESYYLPGRNEISIV